MKQDGFDTYAKKLELAQALAELNVKEKEISLSKGHGRAYFWSVALPPMGAYYFVKYLFFTGGSREDVRAGIIALFLTLISLFISFWLLSSLLGQSTATLPSEDLKRLKDITSPESQKQILELYK